MKTDVETEILKSIILFFFVGIVFTALKAFGIINWSLWWVSLPFLINAVIFIVITISAVGSVCIDAYKYRKIESDRDSSSR